MRTSTIFAVSLPPALATETDRLARKQHMTRSELHRTALREYAAQARLDEAIRVADRERKEGKMQVLGSGGLAALMRRTK